MADLKRRTLYLSTGKQVKLFGNSVAISKPLEIGKGYAPNILSLLRDARNLTQEEVYNDTNIHVGRIETAKANLSVSTLATLCKYFKIRMSEFHERVEKL